MRYLIKFSYDGSNYTGYQTQPGKKTIQEMIEKALFNINNKKDTRLVSSGRTDKGVHAIGAVAHFDIDINITEKKLKKAINSNIPEDIHIINVKKVNEKFHARYNVVSKEYKYIINVGEYNPIERNYVLQYNYKLNIEKMKEAIKYFVGEHDFRAFVTENNLKPNCIRTITKASITSKNNKIYIYFKGDGFLRYQVRNMVGILLKVGQEKVEVTHVKEILDSKSRKKEGQTAPSNGLYLVKVSYK